MIKLFERNTHGRQLISDGYKYPRQKGNEMPMRRLLAALICIVAVCSSCAKIEQEQREETPIDIRIGCTTYPSSYAKAALLNALITREGYTSKVVIEETNQMWDSLGSGNTDVVLSSWIPTIDTNRRAKLGTHIEDLGSNCRNMSNGIFVPAYTYVAFLSELENYGEKFDHRIYVCEESDLTYQETQDMLDQYQLDFEIQMISYKDLDELLTKATENKEWIAVALWTPNGNISQYKLRQLRDTKGVYTNKVDTHTLVHKQFNQPMLEKILNNYYVRPGELNELIQLLEDNQNDLSVVNQWLENNSQVVRRLDNNLLENQIVW